MGLAAMNMEQLAASVRMSRSVSAGVAFARTVDRPEKAHARALVLDLFSLKHFPTSLTVLTMPGLYWTFEKELFAQRRALHIGWKSVKLKNRAKTKVIAIERDNAIYRASLRYAPRFTGAFDEAMNKLKFGNASKSGSSVLKYGSVSYHRIAFEDFIAENGIMLGGAWLDFNGPLNRVRVERLRRLWTVGRPSVVAVTAMNARVDREFGADIREHGFIEALLGDAFPGSRIEHSIRYFDTTPMLQIAFRREVPRVA